MGEGIWDGRFRRTGFYEVIDRHDGFRYQKPVLVYLTTVGGMGTFVEPMDAFPNRVEDGNYITAPGASSECAWKKADQLVEMGSRLNRILEQKCGGEPIPTPLHSCSFGWPL